MDALTSPKNCLNPACSKRVEGRTEKLYCSDSCRSAYHNIHKKEETKKTGQITNALKKNRRILMELLHDKLAISVPENVLTDRAFDLTYHTHRRISKKTGNEYIFCFELAYRKREDGWIQIVHGY